MENQERMIEEEELSEMENQDDDEEGMRDEESEDCDVLLHDVSFTFMVVKYLIDTYFYDSNIVSLKSDNCTVQYKCCKVFPMVQQLAVSYNKTIIWHYGVNGHGKGMVDGMSFLRG